MKSAVPLALFAVSAVGVVQIALGVRQHRERCRLVTGEMHARLMADDEQHPALAALWASLAAFAAEERTYQLHCRRWLLLWSLQHRTGAVASGAIRRVAADFMRHPENRAAWEYARHTLLGEVRDRADRRFVRLFDDAYDDWCAAREAS
ncbi:DUF6082 family protein [Streptomyces sp. NPDC093109]|uniref:DUF6082 family protein n=1 Tax=Streptomyces sp. NPDC093109 TaxID=3154977 RepID=UPI003450D6A6